MRRWAKTSFLKSLSCPLILHSLALAVVSFLSCLRRLGNEIHSHVFTGGRGGSCYAVVGQGHHLMICSYERFVYILFTNYHIPVLGFGDFCPLTAASLVLPSGLGDKAKEGTQEKGGVLLPPCLWCLFACSQFLLIPSHHGTDVVCIIIDFKCEENAECCP